MLCCSGPESGPASSCMLELGMSGTTSCNGKEGWPTGSARGCHINFGCRRVGMDRVEEGRTIVAFGTGEVVEEWGGKFSYKNNIKSYHIISYHNIT